MRPFLILAALALAGCATTYDLALMPRDRGIVYNGTAEDSGRGEGPIAITIDDKHYTGTWVQAVPEQGTAFMSGGIGWGWRHGMLGSMVTYDNPRGGVAKALLTAPGGAGLRCDLRTSAGRGGGVCRDDKGRVYDVQIRAVEHH